MFYVYNGYPQYATSSIAVTAGEWFQVVARVSGAGNQVFVNGVLGGTVPDGTSTFNGYTTAEVFIGGQSNSMPADFDGIIDHCVIWDRALSAYEVADLYHRPFAMFERPTPELWVSAGEEPPAGTGYVFTIIMSSLPVWLVVGLAIGMGYSVDVKRKVA